MKPRRICFYWRPAVLQWPPGQPTSAPSKRSGRNANQSSDAGRQSATLSAEEHLMRRKAFTLVELLVVIGIIALLISILLPSLNRARENANWLKCLSNLRQCGQAFMMYCNNNKGRFPQAGAGTNPHDWIFWEANRKLDDSMIAPYLGI